MAYFTLKFKKKGVEILAGTELRTVEGESATIQRGPEELRRQVGTVVCAVGAQPNDDLYNELVSSGFKVIKIGDCVQPRTILEAVQEGFRRKVPLKSSDPHYRMLRDPTRQLPGSKTMKS